MSKKKDDDYRLGFQYRDTREQEYSNRLSDKLKNSSLTNIEQLIAFPLYVPRQNMATFLFKYELFKKSIEVQGSIVECGVAYGSGLMGFAQFSVIFEPVNYTRKIIGFDTFGGFPNIDPNDSNSDDKHCQKGGMTVDSYQELLDCIELYDLNRPIGHIPKVELIKGDANVEIPKYLKENSHLIVSLLYLDFDLYKPTVTALKNFIPRMPKGAVIAFDELNHPSWPGETMAVMEEIGISNLALKRVPYDTTRSYAILE